MRYADFLQRKTHFGDDSGFDPLWIPDYLFDFQKALVEWSVRKGRCAIFADCGMGKTPMQLVWAENIIRKTNGRVLILTPLAVAHQTVREGEKFGIECYRSVNGELRPGINIINYERLEKLSPSDFAGVVCDESSILKSFDGATRQRVTDFMRKLPYRLLTTATAAPNDYFELGTSSEALGHLGHMDMLNRFFVNDLRNSARGRYHGEVIKWRLKGHAEIPFWRWVCSWARAVRKPSDIGFDDGPFILPLLTETEHVIDATTLPDGMLFALPAVGLAEQREERRRTIKERCEQVATIVGRNGGPALVWCHLNDEGKMLSRILPNATEISGADSDEAKEEKFIAFIKGEINTLVTKPKIGAWGLNFQHCSRIASFPSHSFEQYYQGVRRCWRFGQTKPVTVDLIMTKGEIPVMSNLRRKATAADKMFDSLVHYMGEAMAVRTDLNLTKEEERPSWL